MNLPSTVSELIEGALRDGLAAFHDAGGIVVDRTYIEDGKLVIEGHGLPTSIFVDDGTLDLGVVDRRISDD